ncbi:hypothetical protein ZIOFF_010688 [Zingiber officinale]|uniref:Protein arginine methyltransferase NDUFAF7 n=1 Tax=Zingiber officinale TaxID=94328 RepID=A0A8J5LS90_ZINOF|nr:hypothetical protein ZIOFF_010688 [Zingiber officinale]
MDSCEKEETLAAALLHFLSHSLLLPQHLHESSTDSNLVKHLKSIIKIFVFSVKSQLSSVHGCPISVAEYMEEVLTNPQSGFCINRDAFGAGGDFITSPAVSQMFGEVFL